MDPNAQERVDGGGIGVELSEQKWARRCVDSCSVPGCKDDKCTLHTHAATPSVSDGTAWPNCHLALNAVAVMMQVLLQSRQLQRRAVEETSRVHGAEKDRMPRLWEKRGVNGSTIPALQRLAHRTRHSAQPQIASKDDGWIALDYNQSRILLNSNFV